jgi:heterotetrameric sarcosine oxidase gamma subunit
MTLTARSALGRDFGVRHSLHAPADVSLAEHADIGCVWLTCATDAAAILAPLVAALGYDLPREGGAMIRTGECTAIWMNPRAWLLRCPPAAETETVALVAAAFPDRLVHASAFTDFLCWFSLKGDSAVDFLKQGGFLSLAQNGLRAGHAKRTMIAGIPAILCHEDPSHWLVGVERSRAAYLHGWLTSLISV